MINQAYNKLQQAIYSGDKSSFVRWMGFLNSNYNQELELYPWVKRALETREEVLQETVELHSLAIEASQHAEVTTLRTEHKAIVEEMEADLLQGIVTSLVKEYKAKSTIVPFVR